MAEKPAEEPSSLDGARRRAGTATSSFGVSKREGHDASLYYNSRLNEGLVASREVGDAQICPEEHLNSLICGDSRNLPLPDNCVHLVVTSPPYNASKEYDEDLSLREYLGLLHDVFAECYRVLTPGGRMVINVANLGRKPYIPLSSHINIMMHEIGFLMRGEIIWDKSASAGSSCAWGSFQSASNPCLRDVHEYLLVFSKGNYKLPRTKSERADGRVDTVPRDDFIKHTKSIWSFATERASRVNHPAPFPIELPKRCIELYSFVGDVVLDPFNGSGTTCVAAKQHGRHYIGVDLSEEYCSTAERRLDEVEPFVLDEITH
ncbi:MAG: DNA methyltransferase [Candidatus Poseidonia sp.]|uniref:DNA-methyltransferase n=1 Tax=Poseidonia sp. TaxID=2666344 RepID=UPI0030C54970|nr:DNA methyltransferase [Poseidonia sp.]MDG1552733.1 DNA methyltransferase [Poseidonia sp.]